MAPVDWWHRLGLDQPDHTTSASGSDLREAAALFGLDQARDLIRDALEDRPHDIVVSDYIAHAEEVAGALADFGLEVQIAGMLHGILDEGPGWTIDLLRCLRVPEPVLAVIGLVSRSLHPDLTHTEQFARMVTLRDAALVKIADAAHCSRSGGLHDLGTSAQTCRDVPWAEVRRMLYAGIPAEDITKILRRVAPPLLQELPASAVVVHTLDDLLAIYSVRDLDELAARIIGEYMDLTAYAALRRHRPAVVIGTHGFHLRFPMTLDDFWERVHRSEQMTIEEDPAHGDGNGHTVK